jgi:aerobic carbon-monoxide dehydrogenase small subunit
MPLDEDKDTLKKLFVKVNGQKIERYVNPRMLMIDFLRHELKLTGTHAGCEHGVCGACTILFNNVSARSCLMFAIQAQGADIRTVEGLSPADGQLSDLQQALSRHHALQCGFCTPGMLVTLIEHLNDYAQPTEASIREAISGHLCRCTGYNNIINAALEVSLARQNEKTS